MRDPSVPEECSADARGVARAFRDQYAAFIQEGFTEVQALHLISQMLQASMEDRRDDE